MRLPYAFLRREALAAPTEETQMYIQSVIILVVSLLSVLGAGWIIVSFACFKSLRSFRHQLILGLAISDLAMALNFLSSTAMNIGGEYIGAPEQGTFCSFNGFMTQVFVIQTDYWVLTIAIYTYLILAGHMRLSSRVQDHRMILFSLPWIFSLLWAGIGLRVTGYCDIGAWCWFTSDKVRLFVNFVPRWVIIIIIFAMYARVYFVLHRAQRSFLSFGNLSSDPASCSPVTHQAVQSDQQRRIAADRASKKLKMIARLMLMYPIAYMLIWALPTAIRIYQTTRGSPAPFALQTIDKACVVVQGFIDATIYGLNEGSLSRWRDLISPKAFPIIFGTNSGLSGNTHHSHSITSPRGGDAMPDGSSSSLVNIVSTVDNFTKMNGITTDIESKGSDKDPAVELRTMSGCIDTNWRDAGGGIFVQKTIELNVTNMKEDGELAGRNWK